MKGIDLAGNMKNLYEGNCKTPWREQKRDLKKYEGIATFKQEILTSA